MESRKLETVNGMDIKSIWNRTELRSSKISRGSKLGLSPEVNLAIKQQRRKQQKDVKGFSVWSKAESSGTKLLPSIKQAQDKKDKNLLICPLCFYSTFVPHRMANHEKIHTGDKPYKCNYCNRGYALKHSLTNHLKSHCNNIQKNIKSEIGD